MRAKEEAGMTGQAVSSSKRKQPPRVRREQHHEAFAGRRNCGSRSTEI